MGKKSEAIEWLSWPNKQLFHSQLNNTWSFLELLSIGVFFFSFTTSQLKMQLSN